MAERETSAPVLTSRRLILRPFADEDSADATRLAGVREVARNLSNLPHPLSESLMREWIAANADIAARGGGYAWAITDRATGTLLGAATIHLEAPERTGYIGYWLGVPHWNRGFATEALRLVIDRAFGADAMYRIHATVLPENVPSRRVLEKLGFAETELLRNAVLKDGVFEDRVVYNLTVDDWTGRSLP